MLIGAAPSVPLIVIGLLLTEGGISGVLAIASRDDCHELTSDRTNGAGPAGR